MAAAASFLQAKANNGKWHLRIEDLDPPREEKGAKDKILKTLDAYKLHWDDKVICQSHNLDLYHSVLADLKYLGLTYNCQCSRKGLQSSPIYPGICRNKNHLAKNTATRIITDNINITVADLATGDNNWRLESEVGDFIIKRKDGLFSYQLAVVVDDARFGVSEVIRGIDLIEQTPKQIYLQQLLGYITPRYGHVPLATHPDGTKLSKQTQAPELGLSQKSISGSIFTALEFLKQNPPTELKKANSNELWQWAIENWDIKRLKGKLTASKQY